MRPMPIEELCDDGPDNTGIHEFADVFPHPIPADEVLHCQHRGGKMQVSHKPGLKNL
jgi:hypothetical protein